MTSDDRTVDHDEPNGSFPRTLKSAGDMFPALSVDLVHRGMARGRRLQRVKAAQLTAATLALVLATTGTVVFGTHAVGSSAGRTGSPATAGASTTPAATGSDAVAQWAVATLAGFLPAGGKISDQVGNGFTSLTGQPIGADELQSGTGPADRFAVTFSYTTAHGTSQFGLDTMEMSPAYIPATLACPPAGFAPRDTCTLQHVANGGTIVVHHEFNQSTAVAPQGWPTHDDWTATLLLPDGFTFDLTEYAGGTPASAGSSAGPAAPLLSPQLLAQILANPVWQRTEAGISPTAQIPKEPMSFFTQQMQSWKTNTPGFSSVDMGMWNDGTYYDGTSYTAVQEFETPATPPEAMADLNCTYLEHNAGATSCATATLPDGTKIVTTDGPLAPGSALTSPTVYALHLDGSEEAAREYNASAAVGTGDASAAPALTTAQLQTLALQFSDSVGQ